MGIHGLIGFNHVVADEKDFFGDICNIFQLMGCSFLTTGHKLPCGFVGLKTQMLNITHIYEIIRTISISHIIVSHSQLLTGLAVDWRDAWPGQDPLGSG